MSTNITSSPNVADQPSESDELFYQEAWSTVKLIKLRRRIAELEIELDRNRSELSRSRSECQQLQTNIQSYKAAYTIATRALQEEKDPRLRLFKILRNHASEFVVVKLSSNSSISVLEAAATPEQLGVVIELARLGYLSLQKELFTLTDEGKGLIQSLSSVEQNAPDISA
jgi:hypothetical protein